MVDLDYENLKAKVFAIEIAEVAKRPVATTSTSPAAAIIKPWSPRPAPAAPVGRYVAIRSVLGDIMFFVPGRNLHEKDLRSYCFDGADLSGMDLHGSNFDDCSMMGVKAIGTSFRSANMRNVDLRYSRIEGANFNDADLRDALLCVSAVRHATFSNTLVNPNSRIPDDPKLPRICRIVVRERRLGWE